MNRHRTPDWRSVALMTNRGVSGRACRVARPKMCRRYAAAIRALAPPGSNIPSTIAGRSMVRLASARTGATTSASNAAPTPAASKRNKCHLRPSSPATIDAAETLEIRASRGRQLGTAEHPPLLLAGRSLPVLHLQVRVGQPRLRRRECLLEAEPAPEVGMVHMPANHR